jgi:hypothetical protein
MAFTFTHVKFAGGYPRVENWVLLADAPAYFIENQTHQIEWVRWSNPDIDNGAPHESFGKQWMIWTGKVWELAGIGCGCYSGMNVIQYPDVAKRWVRV